MADSSTNSGQFWLTIVSVISLSVGIVLTVLNIANWHTSTRVQKLQIANALPRLRVFYLEIDDKAFAESNFKESDLTRDPWVDTGILSSMKGKLVSEIIAPELADIEKRISLNGEPKLRNAALVTLRIENNGGGAASRVKILADKYTLPHGGAEMNYSYNEFWGARQNVDLSSEEVTLSIGTMEPETAVIIPLFFQAVIGGIETGAATGPIDPSRVAFRTAIIPKIIEYVDPLGKKEQIEVRATLNTPLRLSPHLTIKG
jgi:hypothetical protein